MPYDIFKEVILSGDSLEGKDITSVCQSSSKLLDYCERNNQEIYRDLLNEEFSLRATDLVGYFDRINTKPSPKQAYIELSRYPSIKKYFNDDIENSRHYNEFGHIWRIYAATQWLLHQNEILSMIQDHYQPEWWFDSTNFVEMMTRQELGSQKLVTVTIPEVLS